MLATFDVSRSTDVFTRIMVQCSVLRSFHCMEVGSQSALLPVHLDFTSSDNKMHRNGENDSIANCKRYR